ncbi:MAG: hypothetical protein AB7T05_05970 [Fimbriimonadaceae bacterium]
MLILAVGYLLWLGFKRPPAAAGAERFTHAVESLDANALYQFALPEEREAGLTVAKLREVLNGRPGQVLSSLTPIGALETRVNGPDQVNGATGRWYRTAKGRRVELGVAVNMAESRPMNQVLLSTLLLAWRADAADQKAPMAELRYSEVMLAGIRRDRGFLASTGLEGIWLSPEEGFLTWDELEERYESRLAK